MLLEKPSKALEIKAEGSSMYNKPFPRGNSKLFRRTSQSSSQSKEYYY